MAVADEVTCHSSAVTPLCQVHQRFVLRHLSLKERFFHNPPPVNSCANLAIHLLRTTFAAMAFVNAPPPLQRSSAFANVRRCPAHMIRAPPTPPPTRVNTAPDILTANPSPTPSTTTTAAAAAAAAAAVAAAAVAAAAVAAARTAVDAPVSAPPSVPHLTPRQPGSASESNRPLPTTSTRRNREDYLNFKVLEAASREDRTREVYFTAPQAPSRKKSTTRTSRRKKGSALQKHSVIDTNFAPDPSSPRSFRTSTSASSSNEDTFNTAQPKTTSANDTIRSYLREIGEVKLLDADKEITLARQISKLLALERISARFKSINGRHPSIEEWADAASMDHPTFRQVLRDGLRAKEHMVAANLRLVVSIAKKYLNRGLTFQDLIQEGSIGLIRGAEKFDGNKGFKFSTYATWWIRQAITRAIADHSRPIRLPVHVNDTISAIRKTTKQLFSELNRPPSESEIAERMRLSVEKLRFLTRSSRSTLSLETPIGRDSRDSAATLGSFIEWNGDTPEEATVKSLLREDIENVLNTLSPRERDVVRMRYGFDDGKMKTLEEIGTIFAVTRERIRQIEAKALRKLRHPTRNAVLREYVYEEK